MRKGILVLAAALMTLAPMSAVAGVWAVDTAYWGGGWYAPYWGPYWGTSYPVYAYPNAGEVKLETKVKTAQVYIDGAFAGNTHQNHEMYLRAGTYKIQIVEGGKVRYAKQVYVVAGKKLKLYPEL